MSGEGVAVWRRDAECNPGEFCWHYTPTNPVTIKRNGQAGRWFSEAEAKELVALAKLAPDVVTELWHGAGVDPVLAQQFEDALDSLEAARQSSGGST